MEKSNNILIIACVVLAIISGISIAALVSCKRQDCGSAIDQGIINEELKRSRADRDSMKTRAESAEQLAASYEEQIIILSKKSKKTNEKLNKDLSAWRTLPNDQRVAFFATELAKVDTIPGW